MKLIILIVTSFLVGCATTPYMTSGVDVNKPSEYAVIETDSDKDHKIFKGLDEIVLISRIDEKSLHSFFRSFPEKAYLTPGRHFIEVKFHYMNTYAFGCVWIDAIAGEQYIVRKLSGRYGVRFWLENKRSGDTVGGNCDFQPKT